MLVPDISELGCHNSSDSVFLTGTHHYIEKLNDMTVIANKPGSITVSLSIQYIQFTFRISKQLHIFAALSSQVASIFSSDLLCHCWLSSGSSSNCSDNEPGRCFTSTKCHKMFFKMTLWCVEPMAAL